MLYYDIKVHHCIFIIKKKLFRSHYKSKLKVFIQLYKFITIIIYKMKMKIIYQTSASNN